MKDLSLITTFTSLNASLIRPFLLLRNDFVLQYFYVAQIPYCKMDYPQFMCAKQVQRETENVDSFSVESLYKIHSWDPCFLNLNPKHWMSCKVYPFVQLFSIVLLFVGFHFLEGHWGRECNRNRNSIPSERQIMWWVLPKWVCVQQRRLSEKGIF